jgi:hypothetical protein
MKNVKGLPDRWAIDIVAEKNHPRLEEFKEWMNKVNQYTYMFTSKYYGLNIAPSLSRIGVNTYNEFELLEGVKLITLDQFFEALLAEKINDAGTAPYFELNRGHKILEHVGEKDGLTPKGEGLWAFHKGDMSIEKKGIGTFNGSHSDAVNDLPIVNEWQPKRVDLVEVSNDKVDWYERTYAGKIDGYDFYFCIKSDSPDSISRYTPSPFKFIRPININQPTQLLLKDAKEAYIKALNLEGKNIEWV